jgi:hypothetical protein
MCTTTCNDNSLFPNYVVVHRWGKKGLTEGYWPDLISKLYLLSPGQYMTERAGDDIQSIAKILAALCCFNDATNLFYNRAPTRPYVPPLDDDTNATDAPPAAATTGAKAVPVAVSSTNGPAVVGEEKKSVAPIAVATAMVPKPPRVWAPSDYSQQCEEVALALLAETTARAAKPIMKQKVATLEKLMQEQAARKAARAPAKVATPAAAAAAGGKKTKGKAPAKATAAPTPAPVAAATTAAAPLVDESDARAKLIFGLLGITKESVPLLLPDDSKDEDKEPSKAGCSDSFDWSRLQDQGAKFYDQMNKQATTQCTLAGVRSVLVFARALHTQVLPAITMSAPEGKDAFSALHVLLEKGKLESYRSIDDILLYCTDP